MARGEPVSTHPALANAQLVTIPDSGHFVYVEQPEAFRAALTDFLL